jgi:hypothetical protein
MSESLEDVIEEDEEQEVRPAEATVQDAVSPATVSAMASLIQSVTARNATLKEFDRSLVWMNIMWAVVLVSFIVVIEMVPAAEEFLKHVILIFRNRTVAQ